MSQLRENGKTILASDAYEKLDSILLRNWKQQVANVG